jgi:Uma2 family endonuclease
MSVGTQPQLVEHLVLHDVSWEAYERLLEAFGDRRLRHTYIDGVLEIMSPLRRHELVKKFLARMIEMMAYQLDIDIECLGSTTLRKQAKQRGLEPDECYWIQHALEAFGNDDFDPNRDPPPDLAIEVNVTYADLSREAVYAALGVPEIWHFDDEDDAVRIVVRSGDAYIPAPRSLALPLFTPEILQRFIDRRAGATERVVMKEFVAWIHEASSP